MNSAMSEPPKPKPIRIAVETFWKSMMMTVAPKRPSPTVNIPATPPVRNATFERGRERAALRRGRGADVPAHREAHPDEPGQRGQERAEHEGQRAVQARLAERELLDRAVQDLGRGDEHQARDRHHDERDGAELPPQVGHRAFLDGSGDRDHLRRALVGGEDATHEDAADDDGEDGGRRREEQPAPLARVERELLVAAFGREDDAAHCCDRSWSPAGNEGKLAATPLRGGLRLAQSDPAPVRTPDQRASSLRRSRGSTVAVCS